MDAYIARQPILNKEKKIFAYELLFRSSAADKTFMDTDADQATSRVIMESFFNKGVDSITGGKPAFINFTSRLLLENTATLFPKDQLIIEILETVEPTPEIIVACRSLQKKGYKLALDDFVYSPELDPLVKMSKIIKFDFLSNTPREIACMMKSMDLKGKWLLAEKIETIEMFNLAVAMGFTLFQGYFFSKPVTLSTKVLSPLKMSYISLMREVSIGEEMNFQRVARAIRDDVALSYKLLKLVNSAYYGLRTEVTDITRAVAIIGTIELRKWVFMIALMGLDSDKPDEIIKMSMIRGRFLENLNTKCRRIESDENAFHIGLFSMLDVLMDVTMDNALEGILLSDEVRMALIHQRGSAYDLLDLVISLERSNWDRVDELAAAMNIDAELISELYLDSIKWCNSLAF
ncbi:MAG: HDOD domain-containing protein [Oscillospiraceae bacterium]|nr:HDOD domain-containing protein [Oscillospiraceae bacterium]